MKQKYMILVLCLISVLFVLACDIPSPIAEMAEAKAAITKASEYSADKYAKKEFDEAIKLLMDTHTFLKEDKPKDAADSAAKALAKANEAYTKSLAPYAQSAIDKAKADLADAKGFNSAEAAPDQTITAEDEIAEAENRYKEAEYLQAYDMACQASDSAKRAKEEVLGNIPELRGQLASLEADYDELKSDNAEQFAKDDMTALAADISTLKTLIESNKIKDAYVTVELAKDKVAKIREAGLANTSRQKISKAEDIIAKVSVSPDAAQVTAEIESAKATVKEANEYHASQAYQLASDTADEALSILDAIALSLEKIALSKGTAKTGGVTTDGKDTSLSEKVVEYIVKWRKINTDCLWRIAEKVYKNARMWPLIYSANRNQIKDPDLIYPGQKLIIPPVPVKEKPSENKTISPAEPSEKKEDTAVPETSEPAAESVEPSSSPSPDSGETPADITDSAPDSSSPEPSPSPDGTDAPVTPPANENAVPK